MKDKSKNFLNINFVPIVPNKNVQKKLLFSKKLSFKTKIKLHFIKKYNKYIPLGIFYYIL